MKSIRTPFLLMTGLFTAMCTEKPLYEIEIEPGTFDRPFSIVSFLLPEELNHNDNYLLINEQQEATPIQVDDDRTAWIVLSGVNAGEKMTFRLVQGTADTGTIFIRENSGKYEVFSGDKAVLTYNLDETDLPRDDIEPVFKRGAYIHPVQTPNGVTITDDYPPNHVHHHGIWAAWTSTVFEGRNPDFWNMRQETGTVLPDKMVKNWEGAVHGGFLSQHQYVDLSASEPVVALKEQWKVRVFNVPGGKYHVFDLDVYHECATSSPLSLPQYRYGGVGFRGHWDWNGADKTIFLTSEGKDRLNGHATRARWCHIGGNVGEQLAGVTIMCHPDNVEAPQPVRIHPTEPFFNYAPSQAADLEITPEKPFRSLYRFVVYDGEPDPEELDRIWNDFAQPITVNISK